VRGRVAVCGSTGSITEPRDSPNEPHASAHQAVFHQLSPGASLSSPLLKCWPEFTRERCDGFVHMHCVRSNASVDFGRGENVCVSTNEREPSRWREYPAVESCMGLRPTLFQSAFPLSASSRLHPPEGVQGWRACPQLPSRVAQQRGATSCRKKQPHLLIAAFHRLHRLSSPSTRATSRRWTRWPSS